MASYSGITAHTIHRNIYRSKTRSDGEQGYTLTENKFKNAVFIVDEASMIGADSGLLDDLIEYIFSGKGCRLILVGDGAQLPPVGCITSPALDLAYLKHQFNVTAAEVELTEVVRQEMDSSILINAHSLRLGIASAEPGAKVSAPKIDIDAGPDVIKLSGEDLQDTIETLHGKYGEDGVVIVTSLNNNKPSLTMDENKELYKKIADDYIDLGSKSKIHSAVIQDQCYQALQVKYAYSLTCHKAQGGQWPAIILDQGYITEDMMDREWLRWLYTGFTRAVKELYLLNFNHKFF